VLPLGPSPLVTGFDLDNVEREFQQLQAELDEIALGLYRITVDDLTKAEAVRVQAEGKDKVGGRDNDGEEETSEDVEVGPTDSVAMVVSWLVGVAFGRFDHRLAIGEREMPPEPEPFDPLPAKSPGMWPADEERREQPSDVLVDDPGHNRDVSSHVSAVAEIVDVAVPEDVRRWLARDFFPLHIRMYSKSRRKAPIYWQLATPSASYSVWLYIHAFTRDTMFRVQNDYVVPKVRHEEFRLRTLEREAGERPAAAQRKEIAEQEGFVEELRSLLDEVRRVAPLWNPDLDDGVIINFAPLWRLVPQHRQWQRELKSTWDEMCAGKYDWAHLAIHLWPERVVPKCAADRSLAIAHGLEDVFWAQGDDGKWTARKTPTHRIDELVAERSSAAVKAALQSLLDAPDVTAGRARRRRSANGTTSRGGL
jgi:hypothetical protein